MKDHLHHMTHIAKNTAHEQQVTSEIMTHIQYLTPNGIIIVLFRHLKFTKKI